MPTKDSSTFVPVDGFGFTYFITDGIAIKIGSTIHDAVRRLETLQCATYRQLHLIGVIPGAENERAVQRRFSRFSIRGEWFLADDTLIEFIKSNARLNAAFCFSLFQSVKPSVIRVPSVAVELPKDPPGKILLVDTAQVLGCSVHVVTRLIDSGRLGRATRGGSRQRQVSVAGLREYMREVAMNDKPLNDLLQKKYGCIVS